MTHKLIRTVLRLTLVPMLMVLLPALALLAWYCWLHWCGNYHAVMDSQLYRSGQLEAADLQEHISKDHLRSILNLRGPNPNESWYQGEMAVALQNGVEHHDITLSAGTLVPLEQSERILALIQNAPKPLLVHCSDGADRTGFVVALYLASQGQSAQTASQQLSLRFGHFPYAHWAFSKTMDDSLALFLENKNIQSTPVTHPISKP